jgi:hypothetical protein
MINKAKLALIAAVVAVSFASPALAQTINGGDETGNASPYSYQPAASDAAVHHAGAHAARRNGLDAYAMDRRPQSNSAPRARMPVDSDDPALTGGGSIGYNELLQQEGN